MKRFRIKAGKHHAKGPDGNYIKYGKDQPGGTIIETELDLVEMFGPLKFERIADVKASTPDESLLDSSSSSSQEEGEGQVDELETMTVNELRFYAEESEVDLTGAHLKSEIIERIKAAMPE